MLLVDLTSPFPVSEISVDASFQWDVFLGLVERHRLLPLVAMRKELLERTMPSGIFNRFVHQIELHKQSALMQMLHTLRLCVLFSEAGIPVIPLKGPCLATQLYNDFSARHSHDIDFLVPESFRTQVDGVMKKAGFENQYRFPPRREKYFYKHLKHHYSYLHSSDHLLAEVHWRLFRYKHLFPVAGEAIFASASKVSFSGIEVTLMNDEQLLLYLCLHGGEHSWFRLHWLRDIAQIVVSGKTDLQRVFLKAVDYSVEKTYCEALLLSSLVFGAKLPDQLFKTAVNEASLPSLYHALKEISGVEYPLKAKKVKVILEKFISRWRLRKNFTYRLSLLWSFYQTTPADWQIIDLPDGLFFLYFPLHPFLWVYRKISVLFASRK